MSKLTAFQNKIDAPHHILAGQLQTGKISNKLLRVSSDCCRLGWGRAEDNLHGQLCPAFKSKYCVYDPPNKLSLCVKASRNIQERIGFLQVFEISGMLGFLGCSRSFVTFQLRKFLDCVRRNMTSWFPSWYCPVKSQHVNISSHQGRSESDSSTVWIHFLNTCLCCACMELESVVSA